RQPSRPSFDPRRTAMRSLLRWLGLCRATPRKRPTRRPQLETLETRAVPAAFPPVITLNNLGTQGATLPGFEDFKRAGNSLKGGGDVNGDGIDDFVVGSALADAGGTDRGAAYVVFGRRSAPAALVVGSGGASGVVERRNADGSLVSSLDPFPGYH